MDSAVRSVTSMRARLLSTKSRNALTGVFSLPMVRMGFLARPFFTAMGCRTLSTTVASTTWANRFSSMANPYSALRLSMKLSRTRSERLSRWSFFSSSRLDSSKVGGALYSRRLMMCQPYWVCTGSERSPSAARAKEASSKGSTMRPVPNMGSSPPLVREL